MSTKAEQVASCIGRRPCVVFSVTGVVTLLISVIAIVVGKFEVSADNSGWQSRNTPMANRQVQHEALWDCYHVESDCWERAPVSFRRQLHAANTSGSTRPAPQDKRRPFGNRRRLSEQAPSPPTSPPEGEEGEESGCWNSYANWNDMMVVYRAKDASTDLLSPPVLQQVCELEGQILAASGYAAGCRSGEGGECTLVNDGACIAPLSTISSLRDATPGGWGCGAAR